MDDALVVCRGQTVRDLDSILDRPAHRYLAMRVYKLAKRGSLEQLRHDIGHRLWFARVGCRQRVMAHIVNCENIRMIERSSGARLLLESL